MTEPESSAQQKGRAAPSRRGFFHTVLGGLLAALAGWVSGGLPREEDSQQSAEATPTAPDSRIAALEAEVARLAEALLQAGGSQPLGLLEGEFGERVVFNKSELTLNNPEGVLLNLVATRGHVGIRFYKDFGFGNEQVTSPWHMGYIERDEGYQSLAILRDWRFTAALWSEEGKLLLGRLDPYPPANEPARARLNVRGTLDEVQAMIEAAPDQAADIFQILGKQGIPHLAVTGEGDIVLGSQNDPNGIVLHDTVDGGAYSLRVSDGQLALRRA